MPSSLRDERMTLGKEIRWLSLFLCHTRHLCVFVVSSRLPILKAVHVLPRNDSAQFKTDACYIQQPQYQKSMHIQVLKQSYCRRPEHKR